MSEAFLCGGSGLGARVRRPRPRVGLVLIVALAGAAPLACGGGGGGAGSGGGGGANTGGSGGATATGGSGAKGGTTGTGGAAGAPGTGGATGTGGSAAGAGGATGSGGATGGAGGVAGATGTGGTAGAGGATGTGAAQGSGGITGTGGAAGAAGTIGAGGAAGAAGSTGAGGTTGTGGTNGTGGAAGAAGSGAGGAGTTGTGGAAGAGGTTGSGGAAGAGGTTVTPGVWSAPVAVAKGANWEKVILDGNGNAMLLYAIHAGKDANGGVFSRPFSPSAGWQPPQSVLVCAGCGLITGASGQNIDADMDAAGFGTIAWVDSVNVTTAAVLARRYDGHAWETTNETLPATATNLHVYVSPDGTTHVISAQNDYYKPSSAAATDAWSGSSTTLLSNANTLWSSFDAQGNGFLAGGSNTNANVARFVSAAPAGWVGLQTAGTASAAMIPHVAAFPGQKGLIVWPDAGQVDYSTFTIAAGWTKQSTVGTLVSTTVSDLEMASNASSAVATWMQAVGSVNNVYASVYNGSAWATPMLVSDGSHTAVDGAGHTPVGIDGQGNAFSVWFQGASTQPDIMFSRYASASGTWSTPSKIATAIGTVGYLQVAVSDNGVAVAAWSVGTLVYASVFETTAPTGTGTGGSSGTGGTSGAGGTGPGPNLLTNGDFSNGLAPWNLVNLLNTSMPVTNYTIQNGQLCVTQASGQSLDLGWPTDLETQGLSLPPNTSYMLSYNGSYAGTQTQPVPVGVGVGPGSFFPGGVTDPFTSTLQPFSHLFATGATGASPVEVVFTLSRGKTGDTFCFSNVSLVVEGTSSQIGTVGGPFGPNLITNGDFSNGQTGWTVTGGGNPTTTTGALCVNAGQAVISTGPIPLVFGATYELSYDITDNFPGEGSGTTAQIGPAGSPSAYVSFTADPTVAVTTPNSFAHVFTAGVYDSTSVLELMTTGSDLLCYDNVSLFQVMAP